MFSDCKSGGTALGGFADLKQAPCGYNLESTYAKGQRLIALILLITIAYTCAIRAGRQCRNMGLQKYVGRLQELKRVSRRHSPFWIGLYGNLWVGAMEHWADLALTLMRLKPGFTTLFSTRSTRHAAYLVYCLVCLSPLQLIHALCAIYKYFSLPDSISYN